MRKIAAFAAVVATLALGSTGASAAVVTVGNPLTAKPIVGGFGTSSITLINTAFPEASARVTSPVTGTIIRWHVLEANGGPFYLRVLRPNGADYTGAGTSLPAAPTSLGLQTFPTSLPIQAGDVVGLEARGPNLSTVGFMTGSGNAANYWQPAVADGATSPSPTPLTAQAAAFNAEVQPPPVLAAISPPAGSIQGQTSVTIVGTDFENATAVSFGNTPAASFTVNSESQITAVSPPAASPGDVDVSVTTLAGTTKVVAAGKFKYEACTVPKLQGKKLKAAKARLKAGNCALGKVKRSGKGPRKKAKVVKQNPKAGTLLAPGSTVKITLRSRLPHKN